MDQDTRSVVSALQDEFARKLAAMQQEFALQLQLQEAKTTETHALWHSQKAALEAELATLRQNHMENSFHDQGSSWDKDIQMGSSPIVLQEPEQTPLPPSPVQPSTRQKRNQRDSLASSGAQSSPMFPSTPTRRTSSRTESGTNAHVNPNNSQSTPTETPRRTPRRTGTQNAAEPATPTRRTRSTAGSLPSTPKTPAKATRSKGHSGIVQDSHPAEEADAPSRRAKAYQLFDNDPNIPVDAAELKKAAFTHFRLMANCPDTDSVPASPTTAEIATFYRRFADEPEVLAQRTGQPLISISSVQVHAYMPTATRSQTRNQLGKIEEVVVKFIASRMSRMGFTRWAPNYIEAPGSLWNTAARITFIDTFRQAVSARTYDYLKGTWKRHINDMDLLIQVYDHIAHYHFFSLWRKEQRLPGRVKLDVKKNSVYQLRKRTAEARREFLEENKLSVYLPLIDRKATSDDERDPDGGFEDCRPIYFIKKRPERSAGMELFIRRLEAAQDMQIGLLSNRTRTDRIRKVPPPSQQKTTGFTALPPDMPIDYYDPAFFNMLPLKVRAKADITKIALPPNPAKTFTNFKTERKLTNEGLMIKYGKTVLSRYNLDGLFGDDDSDDLGGDDEEDEGYGEDDGLEEEKGDSEEDDFSGIDDLLADDGDMARDEDDTMSELDVEEEREHISYKRSKLAAELSMDTGF
ncbi:hypothetical protein D9611_011348 [Ephemerocybe angulata]|uniref:Uncharacterized protein n=1 Tax=Ephemerocybe angulata TaxID=980116 RepID=A0A8H5BBJ9_9AGAR|nr:hypothetical protein D9611_011348 [Tulosesus angulatus]